MKRWKGALSRKAKKGLDDLKTKQTDEEAKVRGSLRGYRSMAQDPALPSSPLNCSKVPRHQTLLIGFEVHSQERTGMEWGLSSIV